MPDSVPPMPITRNSATYTGTGTGNSATARHASSTITEPPNNVLWKPNFCTIMLAGTEKAMLEA